MEHNRRGGSSGHKPQDRPEHVSPPDVESTEGGQSGREIIPDAADAPQGRIRSRV